jgi:hypothetical protein
MLSRKIERVRAALGDLAGKVGTDEWNVISSCRRDLEGVQEYADALEKRLIPPTPEQPQTATA